MGIVYLDMESTSRKSKYDFICSLLERGDAMICLDSGRKGVSVPREHRGNHALNLILNLNFPKPIEVEEDGVCATLSFGGRAHRCLVPMDAIWAVYDPLSGEGKVWADSMPGEVLLKMKQEKRMPPDMNDTRPSETEFFLKPISSPAPEEPGASGSKSSLPRVKKTRRHLRVIK